MKFKFPFFIVLFVFCLVNTFSCKRDTSSNRTALDHAYACQDVLGPLPSFSCADAIEVPTTKNGTPVTFGPTAKFAFAHTVDDFGEEMFFAWVVLYLVDRARTVKLAADAHVE